jgi:hypothetical protein
MYERSSSPSLTVMLTFAAVCVPRHPLTITNSEVRYYRGQPSIPRSISLALDERTSGGLREHEGLQSTLV